MADELKKIMQKDPLHLADDDHPERKDITPEEFSKALNQIAESNDQLSEPASKANTSFGKSMGDAAINALNKRSEGPMEIHDVAPLLEAASYQFAKTMPETPHEYTLRRKWNNDKAFDEVVTFIRKHGKEEQFMNVTYIYLYHNGYKYWTMGAPIPETILINRAKA